MSILDEFYSAEIVEFLYRVYGKEVITTVVDYITSKGYSPDEVKNKDRWLITMLERQRRHLHQVGYHNYRQGLEQQDDDQ